MVKFLCGFFVNLYLCRKCELSPELRCQYLSVESRSTIVIKYLYCSFLDTDLTHTDKVYHLAVCMLFQNS